MTGLIKIKINILGYSGFQKCKVQWKYIDMHGSKMKAYSVDLRKKIIETYEQESISQRDVAKRFRVSLGVVTRLIKRYRETGNLEAKKASGRERKLNQSHHKLVADLVSQQPDITLGELCAEVEKQTKIKVSPATMCRVMKRLNLTRKKKALYSSLHKS